MKLSRLSLSVLLILSLLICSCSQEDDTHTLFLGNFTLEFLVDSSDTVAIIEIFDAPSKGPSSKMKTAKSAPAKVIKNIKGAETDQIIIEGTPHYKAEKSVLHITMLRNGKYLAFLKKAENEGHIFRPTTGASLLSIFKGRIQPIWRDGIDAVNQQGIDVEAVIKVINELKKVKSGRTKQNTKMLMG